MKGVGKTPVGSPKPELIDLGKSTIRGRGVGLLYTSIPALSVAQVQWIPHSPQILL